MTQFEAIVKLTKNGIKPITAYSPAYGWVMIQEVLTKSIHSQVIGCKVGEARFVYFTRDLILTGAEEHAKQMLFPNRECEDWVTYIMRMRPDLRFYIDELVAYREEDRFILARITDIRRDKVEVQTATCGTKQIIPVASVYKLKEVAKRIKKSKDVQSIQAEN